MIQHGHEPGEHPAPLSMHRPFVTFPVDDVPPAVALRETCKPIEAVRALVDAPPGLFAPDESSQGNPTHGRVEACWSYALDCVAGIGHHPLMAAAHIAFSEHRPLTLSPDVIWVTIVQGLAQHIRLDPEAYRQLLVRHDGKRELTVWRDDLHRGSLENPWPAVVSDLAALVHREVGELARQFTCDFSTTGPVERTVSEVALLDVLQPYFSYNVVCICGIPSITLEGTPQDWRNLRDKVDLLAPFDLEWWLSQLRPICDQFARAAAGDVDRDHWRGIYKIRAAYGSDVINGWLGKLFPYLKDFQHGTISRRNDLLDPKVQAEIHELEVAERRRGGKESTPFHAPGITASSLPRGLSQVPFTLTFQDNAKTAMEFLAGPLVVTQDGETRALRPTLGWAVREAPPIEQALLRLADHRIEPTGATLTWKKIGALRVFYLPTDVLRFYRDAAGASLHLANGQPLYRVLPLVEWNKPDEETPAGDRNSKAVRQHLFRFAETSDGTELVIRLDDPQKKDTGAVFVGRNRNGEPPPDTGRKIARSFTDFLLRALDSGAEPYFRRAEFVPLD